MNSASPGPGRVTLELEPLPGTPGNTPTPAEQPLAQDQLDLPLVEATLAAAAAGQPVPGPLDRLRDWWGGLRWQEFWLADQRWLRWVAGWTLLAMILTGAGAALGYREVLRVQSGLQSGDGRTIRTIWGQEIVVPTDPPHPQFGGRGQVLYVLTGITTEDRDKYMGLTDTIMVCLLDFNQERVKVLSIPRDTIVRQGRRWARINEAAPVHNDLSALGKVVGDFLAVEIDSVVGVNYDGFKKVIDALGGVDLVVPKKMHYTDRAGGLYIDFEAGPQHMDGQQALEYARFRHDAEGDFGRIRRQQQLISELKQQKVNLWLIPRLPQLIPAMQEAVQSSEELTYAQLRALLLFAARMRTGDIEFVTLPCFGVMHNGLSVLVPRYDETRKLLDRFFSDQSLELVGPPLPPDFQPEESPAL